MATLVINDLNDDLVNVFCEIASIFRAKIQLVANQIEINQIATPNNLNQTLLTIPQLDGYDDVDIFASDSSPMREIYQSV